MIYLNKPYLPSLEKYHSYIEEAFNNQWLTNHGPLVQRFKERLEEYLGVSNLLPVANATVGLQLAYKTFDLTGDIITTPYTFIATSSSMKWVGLNPVFTDIDEHSLNLCPNGVSQLLEQQNNPNMSAIVPVHLYGNPCNVKAFAQLAEKYNVKLIYDAAQSFGVNINGKSVLAQGDASVLSLHATKVFQSVEGGAVVFKNAEDYERAFNLTNFGIDSQTGEINSCGTNAKMSEMHAAMGLAILDDIDNVIEKRKASVELYKSLLADYVEFPLWHENATQNGAYFPVIFKSSIICDQVSELLKIQNIESRKYFFPILNEMPAFQKSIFKGRGVADDIPNRTLCLPLHYTLSETEIRKISEVILSEIK